MLTNNSLLVNDQLVHPKHGDVIVTGVPQLLDGFGEWGVYVQDAKGKHHYVKTADLKRK